MALREALEGLLDAITSVTIPIINQEIPLDELVQPAIRIATAILIVVIAAVILNIYRGILDRLASGGIIDTASAARVYRITSLALLSFAALLAGYTLTGSMPLLILVLVVVSLLMLSGIDVFANLIGYYIITTSRLVAKGQYILVPNGPHGVVKEIKPLYTVVEDQHGSYAIPNISLLRSGRLMLESTSPIRLVIRVWGFQEVQEVDSIRSLIEEVVLKNSREITAKTGEEGKPRVVIDEMSEDSVTVKVTMVMPGPRPNLSRLTNLIIDLARQLKDSGHSYTITLEEPEGFEQRWRLIA